MAPTIGPCYLLKEGFHPVGKIIRDDRLLTMRTKLLLKSTTELDDRNARHVGAALKCLEQGNVTEACSEIRKIQRIFAGHPSVINLRQRLVAVLCGWEQNGAVLETQCAA